MKQAGSTFKTRKRFSLHSVQVRSGIPCHGMLCLLHGYKELLNKARKGRGEAYMFLLGKALAHLQIVERCALCVLGGGEEENIST